MNVERRQRVRALLARFDAWEIERARQFDIEAETGHFERPDSMFNSDDEAVELLQSFMAELRTP